VNRGLPHRKRAALLPSVSTFSQPRRETAKPVETVSKQAREKIDRYFEE
jgi:hypothetical protein